MKAEKLMFTIQVFQRLTVFSRMIIGDQIGLNRYRKNKSVTNTLCLQHPS